MWKSNTWKDTSWKNTSWVIVITVTLGRKIAAKLPQYLRQFIPYSNFRK